MAIARENTPGHPISRSLVGRLSGVCFGDALCRCDRHPEAAGSCSQKSVGRVQVVDRELEALVSEDRYAMERLLGRNTPSVAGVQREAGDA